MLLLRSGRFSLFPPFSPFRLFTTVRPFSPFSPFTSFSHLSKLSPFTPVTLCSQLNPLSRFPVRSFLPPDLAGACRKRAGKSPDPSGQHQKYLEHGSSIPAWNFPMISGPVLPESAGICRNPPKKTSEIIPVGILLPIS